MRSFLVSISLAALAVLCLGACTGVRSGLLGRKTAHETYLSGLQSSGLGNTRLAALWQSAAAAGLSQPVTVNLPFKESGYFSADTPSASGYMMHLKQGARLSVIMETRPVTGFLVFVELWSSVPGQP